MLVRFIESEPAVADQIDRLQHVLDTTECALTRADPANSELWSSVAEADAGQAVALKCSVPASKIARCLEMCARRFPEATSVADMGMGLVRTSVGSGDLDLIGRVKLLRSEVESIGGSLIIERAPGFIRLEADAWGDPGPEIKIMRSIKQKYDPNSLLSPGRFVSGI